MKFSIPSFSKIVESGLQTYYRFPFVIIVAIIGTIAAILSLELSSYFLDENPWVIKTIFIGWLGISLLTGIDTFAESKSWNTLHKYLGRIIGVCLLLTYFMLAGDKFIEGPDEFYYRFALFALASHLLAAFAPFLSKGNIDQFWEYNKTLFLRICISALYSAVLFVGLSIAMLSIDNLLGIEIKGERYGQLFMFIAGVFNTWFFLNDIPEIGANSETKPQYPKALKVFVQFVLIPLVTVYIGILYLYTGKILIQWELPNGWVSYLVLSFSIVGIFSLLLLYPIRNDENNKWINIYSKGYYLALIPLIGLLLFSIYVRIDEYGVTINRYFVATLGVWLTGIVIYFIVSKIKSIKVIPVSMCLVALGISFGPIGAFSVSERSQLGRFEEVLERNDMLDENLKIIPKTESNEVPFEERKELSSVVDYIVSNHSIMSFEPYFEKIPDTLSGSYDIFSLMKLDYVSRWVNVDNETDSFYFSSENTWAGDISGFDYYLNNIILNSAYDSERIIRVENVSWGISIHEEANILVIEESNSRKSIDIKFSPIINRLQEKSFSLENNFSIPISELEFDFENEELMVRLYLNAISGSYGNTPTITNITADILIKIKE